MGRSFAIIAKQRKVAVAYVKLRGNSKGGDRKPKPQNAVLKITQEDIAEDFGCCQISDKVHYTDCRHIFSDSPLLS